MVCPEQMQGRRREKSTDHSESVTYDVTEAQAEAAEA